MNYQNVTLEEIQQAIRTRRPIEVHGQAKYSMIVFRCEYDDTMEEYLVEGDCTPIHGGETFNCSFPIRNVFKLLRNEKAKG